MKILHLLLRKGKGYFIHPLPPERRCLKVKRKSSLPLRRGGHNIKKVGEEEKKKGTRHDLAPSLQEGGMFVTTILSNRKGRRANGTKEKYRLTLSCPLSKERAVSPRP